MVNQADGNIPLNVWIFFMKWEVFLGKIFTGVESMASIERTCYPRFQEWYSEGELTEQFSPSEEEIRFVREQAGNRSTRLCFAILLKTFQHLGYFPRLSSVPAGIGEAMRNWLDLPPDTPPEMGDTTLYLHHQIIREFLDVVRFDETHERQVTKSMAEQVKIRGGNTSRKPFSLILLPTHGNGRSASGGMRNGCSPCGIWKSVSSTIWPIIFRPETWR